MQGVLKGSHMRVRDRTAWEFVGVGGENARYHSPLVFHPFGKHISFGKVGRSLELVSH
jgi:hypothetical protein